MNNMLELIIEILGKFSGFFCPSETKNNLKTSKTQKIIFFIFTTIILIVSLVGEAIFIKRLIENSTNGSIVSTSIIFIIILLLIIYCCLHSIYRNLEIYRLKKQMKKH